MPPVRVSRWAGAAAGGLLATLGALGAAAPSAAAQVSVAVSAPATVAAGEPALVRVEVTAPAAADVRLEPPSLAPFTLARTTRVPPVDAAAGRGWRRHEWRYVLAPPPGARGRYAFAPFSAAVTGPSLRPWTARSRAWALVVRAPAPPVPAGAVARAAGPAGAQGRRAGVTFRARVYPDAVYVGQQVTYELTVTVDAAARARIRRNPEFVPPELRGVLAVDLPASHEATGAGDVHVYRRALFALAPGVVAVPSARLTYAMALGSGYFSPEERVALRTEPVQFVARPAPAAGRPPGWDGAVGTLRASARVGGGRGRAGDPVEFTVRVDGEANVGLLPRPAFAVPWADVIESGDRVEIDSGSAEVRGAKEFTWLLTPRAPGAFATPAIRYPYFDPAIGRYETLVVPPVRVDAAPSAGAPPVAAFDGARPAPPRGRGDRLAIRTTWRGAFARPLPSRPAFWLLLGLAPAPAALVLAGRRARRRRARRPADPLRAVRRLAGAGAGADHRGTAGALRRLVYQAFEHRVGFAPSAAHGPAAFGRALRRAGTTTVTADRAAALVAALDAAAFDAAPEQSEGVSPQLAREAGLVLELVDREAQPCSAPADRLHAWPGRGGSSGRTAARAWLGAAVVGTAVATLGACVAARSPSGARGQADVGASAFARGADAYGRGDLAAARAAFDEAAARAPRAPDAWANAGTAAWAQADTLGAAVAWQRALRLEPAARDLRARLALLPAAQDGWVAGVPPVDPNWPGTVAAILATAVALLAVGAAVPVRRAAARSAGAGARAAWPWAWGAALALGGAGAGLARHADPSDRAIVTRAGALRTEPALTAEAGPPVDPTDVVRLLGRAGPWVRVALDGGRDGWIEAARLAPLAFPAPAPAEASARGR